MSTSMWTKIVSALASTALLALGLCAGCGSSDATPAPDARGAGQGPAPVRVEPVKRGPIKVELNLVGEVIARRAVDVAVEAGGKLLEVNVEMGQEVTKGQILAKLDTTVARARLAEAQAARAVSQAAIQRAEADYQSAANDLARKAPLAEDNLITPNEMDQLRSKRDSAQAGLGVARAQTTQAGAAIQIFRQQLADALVLAPFDGRVQERLLDPGAFVKSGSPILRLVHTNPAVARFQVSEHAVGRLRARAKASEQAPLAVKLTLPAYPRKSWTGELVRLSPALDPATRAATAEAEFENRTGDLMPGMFCRVSIDLGGREDVLLLPLVALVGQSKAGASSSIVGKQRGDDAVFIVRDGEAKRTPIKVGAERDGYGEILEGLQAGDMVVTEGHLSLRDGRAVRVIERDQR